MECPAACRTTGSCNHLLCRLSQYSDGVSRSAFEHLTEMPGIFESEPSATCAMFARVANSLFARSLFLEIIAQQAVEFHKYIRVFQQR